MNNKPAETQRNGTRQYPVLGVTFALAIALVAEVVLGRFTPQNNSFGEIGRVAVVFLSLYTIHRFAFAALKHYRPHPKDLLTMALVLLGSIGIVWIGRILAYSVTKYAVSSHVFGDVVPESLYYAIPYAGGALMVQGIMGLHYGFVFSLSLAVVVGMYSPGQPIMIPYVLLTSLVACLSLLQFRSRSAYLRAGFNIGVVALPFALASIVIDGSPGATDITLRLLGALMGGGLCTFVAAGFTPILETVGGYVTDMRLLEMATIDHALLKELSITAPGTWNHSMVMGMMVEAAASEIGANPVLARVGAYFHDIGKVKKPLYFVENQSGGENRHDKLSTSMSALIIRSHVKDGIELAKKHKLPEPIIDMIPQHHGTSMIEFFYDKACKETEEAGEEAPEVDRSLYTYPGPKPQTKEAGILMLADGIEAATRTLSDPTADRVQGLVQKMINKVFASGELDECDLTLKDLHIIAKNFTRVLAGIYHQRVAYAEPAEKINEKAPPKANGKKEGRKSSRKERDKEREKAAAEAENKEKAVGDTDPAQSEEPASEEKEDRKEGEEDLKRLGI